MSQRKINATKRTIISGQARNTNLKQGTFYYLEKDGMNENKDYLKHKPYACDLNGKGRG